MTRAADRVLGATGKARSKFYVIAARPQGKREWTRGTFNAIVRYAANKHGSSFV